MTPVEVLPVFPDFDVRFQTSNISSLKIKANGNFYIENYLQYDLWNEKSLVIDQNLALLMTDIYLPGTL